MALNAYDELHHEVYNEVYSLLERKDRENLRFAPIGTAEYVLHADKLRRFFDSLQQPGRTTIDQFQVTNDELISTVGAKELHPFLAVLIIVACSLASARIVVAKLIASDTSPTITYTLPIGRDDLQSLFDGNSVDADKFLGKQAYFCPVRIRKKEETRVDNTEHRRLPYLEEQSLQKGSFGHVLRMKIAKGHFYDRIKETTNLKPVELARKDYEVSDEFDATGERQIMERILASSAWDCPNILRNLGSLAFGSTVYSLFMPLAICDLRAYMMTHHQTRPNSITEKADIIRCAMGLAGGLHFLHNEMKASDLEQLVCYHMDLKPSNILIFRETGPDRQVRNIWKLSDFGMSRMKVRYSGGAFSGARDINSWFIRRSEPEDPSLVSGTLNRRGEGTYLAPESLSPTRTMRTHSDVWSLGCVLSVVFAYLEEGSDGVKNYAEQRYRHDEAAGYDRFFVLSCGFRAAKRNRAVEKTHSYLVDRARERDSREAKIIKEALGYIEDQVLEVDQFKRRSAKEVATMLEITLRGYKQLPTDHGSHLSMETEPTERPRHGLFTRIHHSFTSLPNERVERWCLSESQPFKGSQISPDCSFVTYWTDRTILLYSSHTLEKENCFWNSVRLTEKYLVASTTSTTFQCYIFDLADGGLGKDQSVDLEQPAIVKLAISPDSQLVACVLRSSDDDRAPGDLLVIRLTEVCNRRRECETSIAEALPLDRTTSGPVDAPFTDSWWKRTLHWPAGNVSRLSFSTDVDLYFMVRPELRAPKGSNAVCIAHLNLETKGLDSSSSARLLTDFAPLHQNVTTCAIITREKQLHIHDLAATSIVKSIQLDIKTYRVRKLLIRLEDDTLYAVAGQSANSRMVLVRMTVPHSNTDDNRPTEIAQLEDFSEDDPFTMRLSEMSGLKSVLISSVVGAGRPAIRKIEID
ncbi:kinase-like domain-containing protein [Aspergillus stella-maris]|uniref:kinase-like domain-containing protein n=1 Tax=Aspergillus stella-maris TaxID=1810926 RepID=UPI003CCDC995